MNPPTQQEEGLSLRQLLIEVERAARGNLALGTQLARITEQVSHDEQLPQDVRTLALVLRHILAGERAPDLSALPDSIARTIHQMTRNLLEDERTRKPDIVVDEDQEEGLTLDELLGLIEKAVNGDQTLAAQLFALLQQMARDEILVADARSLAKVLMLVLVGDYSPDLSQLSPQYAVPIKKFLQNLRN